MDDDGVTEPNRHSYLGDGVYASFDGYHIWLRKGSHDAPIEGAIALEPDVFEALLRYQMTHSPVKP